MPWPDFQIIDKPEDYEPEPEFHAVLTISLGELIQSGVFDCEDPSWRWDAYSSEQYSRLMRKIRDRYYWREISCLPILRWKTEFLRKLNEIMPKYKLLYKRIEEGLPILSDSSEYGKSRDIMSTFPQTMLSGANQDYASSGNDREYEIIREGSTIAKIMELKRYDDVDVMILDEMESLFSPLMSVGGINAY